MEANKKANDAVWTGHVTRIKAHRNSYEHGRNKRYSRDTLMFTPTYVYITLMFTLSTRTQLLARSSFV